MATPKKVNAPIQSKEDKGFEVLKAYVSSDAVMAKFGLILGKKVESLAYHVLSAATHNKHLCLCDPESLCNAVAASISLDLSISDALRFASIETNEKTTLNPVTNKYEKTILAEFSIGWKGLIQLAQRTREYKTINVSDVRQGELKSIDRLTGDTDFVWVGDNVARNKMPIVGYVSFFRLTNGFEKSLYWDMEKIMAHAAKYSKTFSALDSRWKTDEESMCRKTLLKRLLADYGYLNTDITFAIAADQANIKSLADKEFEYPDNPVQQAPPQPANKSVGKANKALERTIQKLATKKAIIKKK